jgi:hypothetical protein
VRCRGEPKSVTIELFPLSLGHNKNITLNNGHGQH